MQLSDLTAKSISSIIPSTNQYWKYGLSLSSHGSTRQGRVEQPNDEEVDMVSKSLSRTGCGTLACLSSLCIGAIHSDAATCFRVSRVQRGLRASRVQRGAIPPRQRAVLLSAQLALRQPTPRDELML